MLPGVSQVPRESYPRLFLRFLRFGLLAWGGPVAQISMVREELVERERWISRERFNRVLSIYQVLPGPEAHELCVYFGYIARGRIGGLLAGLGFMLPGFLLTLVIFRFGRHALTDRGLWVIGVAAAATDLAGVHFGVTLLVAGLAYASVHRGHLVWTAVVIGVAVAAVMLVPVLRNAGTPSPALAAVVSAEPSILELFGAGLLTGLLTFGGAYTAIPFLRREAVVVGGWMTDAQFVDGLAITGVLPAPLIIFGTFVGYVGGGLAGAVAVTVGIFLPAFAFTLIGHGIVERIVQASALHAFLDGVTAGVVGLIVSTTIRLVPTSIPDLPAAVIAGLAFLLLVLWRSKLAIAAAVLGAGALGMLVVRL
jgi:chromate transporter